MAKKMSAGLAEYGRKTPTTDIAEDVKDAADDPGALAAWIRRRAKGMSKSEFARYGARMKREGK